MKEKLKFIVRVALIHVATYILCGMVFSALFNYQELYLLGSARSFMRPLSGTSTLIGPLFQVVRGVLFGIILLLIRDKFTERYGWLKLWALIAVLGIINTPGPSPSSIEGIIYTQLPLELHIKGAPEILVQTLVFSYFVAKPKKEKKKIKFIEENKTSFIMMLIGGIGFAVSGMALTFILKLDVMTGAKDPGAFAVMLASMLIIFLITKWYLGKATKLKAIILALLYYIAVAAMPTIYNFITNSPFKSLLALALNVLPVVIMLVYLYLSEIKVNRKIVRNL